LETKGNRRETPLQGQAWFFQSKNKNIFDPDSKYPLTTTLHEKAKKNSMM